MGVKVQQDDKNTHTSALTDTCSVGYYYVSVDYLASSRLQLLDGRARNQAIKQTSNHRGGRQVALHGDKTRNVYDEL